MQFDRLRKLGVKFNLETLPNAGAAYCGTKWKGILSRWDGTPWNADFNFGKITACCVQSFGERFKILSSALTGKLQLSQKKEEFLKKTESPHLGQKRRPFFRIELQDEDVQNADETHFVMNVDNGRTLDFKGDEFVKSGDVVSGREGMTPVVRLSGGRHARTEPDLSCFKSKDRNYNIWRCSK